MRACDIEMVKDTNIQITAVIDIRKRLHMSNKNTTEIEDTNYIIILKQIKKIMVVL
jgi:chemotaxis signal transduction protein